jgi:hypothetical protein
MANFLEFLKSGKSAREFIDTAILPQHVLPVGQTVFSPEPYEPEEGETNTEATDAVLDAALDNPPEPPAEDDKTADMDDEVDPDFLAALEAAEEGADND